MVSTINSFNPLINNFGYNVHGQKYYCIFGLFKPAQPEPKIAQDDNQLDFCIDFTHCHFSFLPECQPHYL
jgi:hypothetical protein